MSATREDRDNSGNPAVWFEGMALIDGNAAHRAAWKPEPVVCVQRCLPSRRQQAGSLEFVSEANSAGAISEKLNRTSSRDARIRRTCFYSSVVAIPFCCSA